ncbi:MAG: HflX family GTPase [Methanobacteriota archaeon]|nr:MAG: HflX family GTPase [Euryarchaeota archaeon]
MNREKAVLISHLPKHGLPEDPEIHDLAVAANYEIVHEFKYRGSKIDRMNFLPQSWLEDLQFELEEKQYDLIIVNKSLSPMQVSNLETHFERRVLDKIMLVLEIFDKKASTKEVKLQIELANLLYTYPRAQSSLQRNLMSERQARMMGRGEQLKDIVESNVRHRVAKLRKKIEELERQGLSRKEGEAVKIPIVGFYSAGKSTLFNILVGEDIQDVHHEAFTTMFAKTSRTKIFGYPVDLLDTVGLVDLPRNVLNAFNQMLKPIMTARVIVIVFDSSLDLSIFEDQLKYVRRIFTTSEETVPRKFLVILSKVDLASKVQIEEKRRILSEEEWLGGSETRIMKTRMDDPDCIRSKFVENFEFLMSDEIIEFSFVGVHPRNLTKFYDWCRVDDVQWHDDGTCTVKGKTTRDWFIKLNRLD